MSLRSDQKGSTVEIYNPITHFAYRHSASEQNILNFLLFFFLFSASKSLESLVHDLSNSVDKIFQRLDTRLQGAAHHDYAIIGDHFGYDYFEIRSKFEKCDGSPSRAMLEAIAVRYPELTMEEFARVVEAETPRKDVVHLLRAYDRG